MISLTAVLAFGIAAASVIISAFGSGSVLTLILLLAVLLVAALTGAVFVAMFIMSGNPEPKGGLVEREELLNEVRDALKERQGSGSEKGADEEARELLNRIPEDKRKEKTDMS